MNNNTHAKSLGILFVIWCQYAVRVAFPFSDEILAGKEILLLLRQK